MTSLRRLMLLRHAKSDRTPGVEDEARPLNARGRASAPAVGAYLAQQKMFPDLIVCSTAKRTRQTYDLLAANLPKSTRVVFDEALYLAESDDILALIRALPATVTSVMLIGHNPGLHDTAIALAGTGDADLRAQLRAKFPTAALAVIDFARNDWAVRPRGGRLEGYITPKSIAEDD